MFNKIILNLKNQSPLVHNITNYVTVNDVANSLLAIGASPIMSDEIKDVRQLIPITNAVNINIGTLNSRTIKSMFAAGKIANNLNKIVILDPAGAGATKFRTQVSIKLIKQIHFDVIKGNMSEIKTLANFFCNGSSNAQKKQNHTKGVDVNENDIVTKNNLEANIQLVKKFAKITKSIIVATGKIDLITDGEKCFVITNGHELMEKVCGTGCIISGLMAAFISSNKENKLEAASACICAMGICGEHSVKNLNEHEGNLTLRNKIIDELMFIDDEILQSEAKFELK